MTAGPNGQPSYEQLIMQRRDTSRRMREAATLLQDTADRLTSTGAWPGLSQLILDASRDLGNLAYAVALHRAAGRDNGHHEKGRGPMTIDTTARHADDAALATYTNRTMRDLITAERAKPKPDRTWLAAAEHAVAESDKLGRQANGALLRGLADGTRARCISHVLGSAVHQLAAMAHPDRAHLRPGRTRRLPRGARRGGTAGPRRDGQRARPDRQPGAASSPRSPSTSRCSAGPGR